MEELRGPPPEQHLMEMRKEGAPWIRPHPQPPGTPAHAWGPLITHCHPPLPKSQVLSLPRPLYPLIQVPHLYPCSVLERGVGPLHLPHLLR
jgi:hypothetical protein